MTKTFYVLMISLLSAVIYSCGGGGDKPSSETPTEAPQSMVRMRLPTTPNVAKVNLMPKM
ncbi:MAG: hypothetical protein IPN94_09525 [Sphingobacteriales bacterium]|nr:hypothetical protein [Sphingobacteriales bacterium]